MSQTASAADMPTAVPTVPWWLVLIQGVAAIILGILLFTTPGETLAVLVVLLGWYWLISGIFDIISLFMDRTSWGWKLFSGILGIIAGILVIQHPLWATLLVPTTLIIILGIFGIIIGIMQLIRAFTGGGWGIGILGAVSILLGLVLLFNPLVGAVALPWVLGAFLLVGGIAATIMSFRLR